MVSVANTVEDDLGIRSKCIKEDKKLYWGVNQGY